MMQGGAGMLVALNVETGEPRWTRNFREEFDADMPICGFASSPLVDGERLITLAGGVPDAAVHWKGESNSEILTEGLHSVLATPVILNGHIYGVDSYGQLRCLDAATGERIWETQAATVERAR